MLELRLHGRGGQGSVVASKILADAVVRAGKYVQAFPEYGVERRGAPVFAFVRIDDKPINLRSKIYNPDHIIVLDPTLIEAINVTEGLKKGGVILINSEQDPSHFKDLKDFNVMTVDATKIAVKHRLGSKASPIVNTAILGAVIKAFGVASLKDLTGAIKDGVPVKVEENIAAAEEAYESLKGGKQNV